MNKQQTNFKTTAEKTERSFPRTRDSAFCMFCGKPVNLLSLAETAAFYKGTVESVGTIAERGGIHKIHNSKGEIMVCGESFFENFNRRETQILKISILPRLV